MILLLILKVRINGKITWQMVDLGVDTIRVFLPHIDEFVPENCGIINGLPY